MTPPRDKPSSCTCALLRRATRRATAFYDAALQPTGLRLTQYALLAMMARQGDLPLGRLADLLAMDRTTLTRNLGPLERAGLVTRRAGDDRRSRLVSLTAEGRARLAAAQPCWAQGERRFRAALGEDEAATLRDALHAVTDLGPVDKTGAT